MKTIVEYVTEINSFEELGTTEDSLAQNEIRLKIFSVENFSGNSPSS